MAKQGEDLRSMNGTGPWPAEAEAEKAVQRKKLADQGLASLIVPKGLHEWIWGAAQAGGLTHPELIGMYEAEIRDLLAGRLAHIGSGDRIPSLLDRLKQRAHEELEEKLGKLLEPVAGR